MKKLSMLFLTVALVLASVCVNAQSNTQKVITDPIDYNDYLVQQQTNIVNELNQLMLVIDDVLSTQVDAEKVLNNIVSAITIAQDNIKNLKPLNPDFDFRKNVLALFDFYQKIMKNEYRKIVEEIYKPTPDETILNNYIKYIVDEEKKFDDLYLKSQNDFAKHYDFTLTPQETEE